MSFDVAAFNGAMRAIYGPGIEQLIYPENNAVPYNRIARNPQQGTTYPIPLICSALYDALMEGTGITTLNLGVCAKDMKNSTVTLGHGEIHLDEEWVDA